MEKTEKDGPLCENNQLVLHFLGAGLRIPVPSARCEPGRLSGFLYMFLLFIQLGLFDTPLHFNRGRIVLFESFVAVHGTLITVHKHNAL